MQALELAIMQRIIKIFSPASPAYGNALAFERGSTPKEVQRSLKAGDIIFSRTNSNVYEVARKFMGMKYDHVAVVINEREVIHISPPIISKLDLSFFVDPIREPLIIRPKLESSEKFLVVMNNYMGEKYNMQAVVQMALRELQSKLSRSQHNVFSLANLKHSRICSDSVLYGLIRANPALEEIVKGDIKKTKFEELGFFLPDEVADFLLASNSEIILQSKLQHEYKLVSACSIGGEKVLGVTRKIVQIGEKGHRKIRQITGKFGNQKKETGLLKPKLKGLQIVSLMMALAHTLGVVTLSSKIRMCMLMLHTAMLIGHFQEVKQYMIKSQSRL